jgi:H+-transporting ATPase
MPAATCCLQSLRACITMHQITNTPAPRYETTKAGDAVAALKASLKPTATVKRDGKWQTMDAGALVPGDLVLLASGSSVPADCLVSTHTQCACAQGLRSW